jgi:hypothetical protein
VKATLVGGEGRSLNFSGTERSIKMEPDNEVGDVRLGPKWVHSHRMDVPFQKISFPRPGISHVHGRRGTEVLTWFNVGNQRTWSWIMEE